VADPKNLNRAGDDIRKTLSAPAPAVHHKLPRAGQTTVQRIRFAHVSNGWFVKRLAPAAAIA
jgi:hypothetical protein